MILRIDATRKPGRHVMPAESMRPTGFSAFTSAAPNLATIKASRCGPLAHIAVCPPSPEKIADTAENPYSKGKGIETDLHKPNRDGDYVRLDTHTVCGHSLGLRERPVF